MSTNTRQPLLFTRDELLARFAAQPLPLQQGFHALLQLADSLQQPLYLVGGAVRDLLMHVTPRDMDIMVEGSAVELAHKAQVAFGGHVDTSSAFQTACWYPQNSVLGIDMAAARAETYAQPAALPTVRLACMQDDLQRRDFTINAMAIGLQKKDFGMLYDFYDGTGDLQSRTLRVLHAKSFYDDPTRAFRAARFACRLGFVLSPDTAEYLRLALRDQVVAKLSDERLGAQIDLILAEAQPVEILTLLQDWQVLQQVLPLSANNTQWSTAILRAQDALRVLRAQVPHIPSQTQVLWCQLACMLPCHVRVANVRWLAGAKERDSWLTGPERLQGLTQAFSRQQLSFVNRALAKLSMAECCCAYAQSDSMQKQQHVLWWLQTGYEIKSQVDGHMLKKLGFVESPQFKPALLAALDVAREGADAAAQLQAALQILQNEPKQ